MQEVIIIAVSVLSLIVSIAVLIIVLKKNNNQEEKLQRTRLSVLYEMSLQHNKAY